jgi:signal transduction histidine kinase
MNQEPENFFDSASPEQKLHWLTAELRTPVEIIRGFAETIRVTNLSQKIEPEGILISAISEAVDKIRNLLDEVVRSKGFYTPSHDLSSTDILLGLRQHLLHARQEDDKDTLQSLASFLTCSGRLRPKRKIKE